jgi:hypothetical protein
LSEACRIVITQEPAGLVNVSAPMKYKALCFDILRDAKRVIELTPDVDFFSPGKTLIITMNMTGLVDVAAPLPDRSWCEIALKAARLIIEQFDSPEQKTRPAGYADCLPAA